MKNKGLVYGYLIVLLLILAIIVYRDRWFFYKQKPIAKMPNNFEECLASGFPIRESYPRQCQLPSGQNFTEDIGNGLEKADLIIVDNPRPNSNIKSPVIISGKARGTWFFEGSFPISLIDNNNTEIIATIAQARGDWMTEEFVQFTANLNIPDSFSGKAKLILKKDNPSGDSLRDDQLIIPLTIIN